MKIAILMMQKNEEELLGKWIAYHSYLVGHENLFIFDNGSDSAITENELSKAAGAGTKVIRSYDTKKDYECRGDIFCEFIKNLDSESNYDFYMLIDCDEFLACLDDEGVISCDKGALKYELTKYLDVEGTLLIDSQFYNSSVSAYWFNKQPYRKCFFRRGTIKSLDQGFHWGKVEQSDSETRTGVVHIHFHNKPYAVAKAHAEEKLRGRVKDFSLETLSQYKGKGFHLVRYFTANEQNYIGGQINLNHIYSDSLVSKLGTLQQDWPYEDEVLQTAEQHGFSDTGVGFHKKLKTFNGSIDNIKFENGLLIVSGWGIIRHSKPILTLYLKIDGYAHLPLELKERTERLDVNEMLNVKGEYLGFTATCSINELPDRTTGDVLGKLVTFLNFDREFFEFDMRRHLRSFDYSSKS